MKCVATAFVLLAGTMTANALPACNDSGVRDLLLRMMYQEPISALGQNSAKTDEWSAQIENFRQLAEKPDGTKICAAEIIYSGGANPSAIAAALLGRAMFAGDARSEQLMKRVCLGEFRFTIESLLDKPDQYHVRYTCTDN